MRKTVQRSDGVHAVSRGPVLFPKVYSQIQWAGGTKHLKKISSVPPACVQCATAVNTILALERLDFICNAGRVLYYLQGQHNNMPCSYLHLKLEPEFLT